MIIVFSIAAVVFCVVDSARQEALRQLCNANVAMCIVCCGVAPVIVLQLLRSIDALCSDENFHSRLDKLDKGRGGCFSNKGKRMTMTLLVMCDM